MYGGRGRGRGMRWRGGASTGPGPRAGPPQSGPVQSSPSMSSVPPPPPPPIISQEPVELKMEDQDDANGLDLHDPGEEVPEEPQEVYEDEVMVSDNEAQEGDEDPEMKGNKRPWRGFRGGTRMKRKKVPGAKNRRIKKYAQPKNAVMCLNELNPGVAYICEQEGGISQPCCMSVEANGQKYRGFGSSKQLAKQAAAEAALISFVKPPVTNSENPEDDKTPWATLVSFAMYKLFNDWREGRVGMCPPQAQPYGTAIPQDIKSLFAQSTGGGGGGGGGGNGGNDNSCGNGEGKDGSQPASFMDAIGAHLDGRGPVIPATENKPEQKVLPKPAKQVPEGAAGMHPVMVLNQMKPGVQYNISETIRDGKPFFIITSELDDQSFTGEGTNVKKAKVSLAKAAILGLYGVESTFES